MYGKCSKTDLIINSGLGLASKLIWHANPDNWRPIHSKKRLKFPDYFHSIYNVLNLKSYRIKRLKDLSFMTLSSNLSEYRPQDEISSCLALIEFFLAILA
ncbi:unnamed protein product [Rhizophagus irregularis]|nr:unnamed protein product [Rhizophagus irregularis]